jgi:3'-5' exonuclease
VNKVFLAFDIETIPCQWDSFSDSQREYIVRGATTEEETEKKMNEMALSPLTAQIVCIGFQFIVKGDDGEYVIKKKGAYAVDNAFEGAEPIEKTLTDGSQCKLMSETMMLERFWSIFRNENYRNAHLVSFNGRNFDAPFLMMRSALLGVRPSRNIMNGTKFNYALHTDLIDELTFYSPSSYGATRRYNFDFYTRAFGLTSPKSEGIDGSKVADYFAQGKILEISEYCLRDVTATWQLFLIWEQLLKFD